MKNAGFPDSPTAKVREKGRADYASLQQEEAKKQPGLATFTDSALGLGELITGKD